MPFNSVPEIINWRRDACNGMYPSADFLQRCIEAENFLTAQCHKEAFRADWRLSSTAHGLSGPTNLRRFRFRSGHGATRLSAALNIGKAYNGGATPSAPYVKIEVTKSGGATTTMGPWYPPVTLSAPTDAPSEQSYVFGEIAIDANSIYECVLITSDYARPLGVSVVELGSATASEATPYYNQRTPQAGGPIVDDDRSRLLVGVDAMLRHNGGTVWHWGHSAGTARTRTSATAINLIDNATTGTPTAATHGAYLDMTYRNTTSRTTVPMELGVYGSVAGGGTGTVTVIDTGGTVRGTATVNSATPGWFTGTVNLPASAAKYDFQFAGDGANVLTVNAVSLIEWET